MGKRGHICINIIGMHEDRKQFISIVNKQCIHKLGKTLYTRALHNAALNSDDLDIALMTKKS